MPQSAESDLCLHRLLCGIIKVYMVLQLKKIGLVLEFCLLQETLCAIINLNIGTDGPEQTV